MNRLLTSTELADALGVSLSTVRRMTRDGQIPCVRVRSLVRYHFEAVLVVIGRGQSSSSNQSSASSE